MGILVRCSSRYPCVAWGGFCREKMGLRCVSKISLGFAYSVPLCCAVEIQKHILLPDDRNVGCAIIGNLIQGTKAEGRRIARRLVTDEGELKFLIRDTRQADVPLAMFSRTMTVSRTMTCCIYAPLGKHAFIYAHTNVIAMMNRFTSMHVARVATDSV